MATVTESITRRSLLSDQLLDACAQRAPRYDRENSFFQEDYEALRKAGYTLMAIPKEFGGLGLTYAEVMKETRRLAEYAPATALALNMHVYWTGVAADVSRSGDPSMDWLLKEAAAGEIFAAGHAEAGNDMPVLLSTTKAERVDGGWRFTGRKSFGSLTPVWTRLGIHGMDTSDPASPKIVHAFMPRDAAGFEIVDVWDSLGMRATQSQDTVLNGVIVPERYVPRVVPAGFAGADLFILGIFMWALGGFGNVYYGLANRAFKLTIDSLKNKSSIAMQRSMAHHPGVQHGVAEMKIILDSIGPQLDLVAEDWSNGVEGRNYASDIVSAKYSATEGAFEVVDRAMDLAGGFAINKRSELERLFRDARLGRIHPANWMLTHEILAKFALGINPDDQPRFG
jgi:alkylation response protein AidB-like acyl-CoA dehydrogenase